MLETGTNANARLPIRGQIPEGKQPAWTLKSWTKNKKISNSRLWKIVNLEEVISIRALSKAKRAGEKGRLTRGRVSSPGRS